jgi:hypothetical protein
MENEHVHLSANIRFSAMILFFCLLLAPTLLKAQGDLLITPRRIVFEGNNNMQEITLANTGNDTARYTVSFLQYRMTEDGAFEQITEPDPGQMFADPYLRYFPRTVTLAPRESQILRMQFRRTPEMASGEYRSHMYFRAVPEEKPLGEEDRPEDSTAIGIRLTPIFGISIPVIVRVGEVNCTITLTEINLNRQGEMPMLSLAFNRAGNMSVYGDLIVEHVSPEGKTTQVGVVRGIGVYTPNLVRRFSMELRDAKEVNLSQGKLVIKFISPSETKPQVFAESVLPLTP